MSRYVFTFIAFLIVFNAGSTAVDGQQTGGSRDAIEQNVQQVRSLVNKSADDLAKYGEQKAIEVLAELTFGRQKAKQESKEANAERSNLELQKYFDSLKARNDEIRQIVQEETRKIKEQNANDSAECNRRLLELIDSFKDEKAELRRNGKVALGLIEKAKTDLTLARDLVASIDRQKRQLVRDLKISGGDTPEQLVQLSRFTNNSLGFGVDVLKKHNIDLQKLGLEPEAVPVVTANDANTEVRDATKELAELETDFDFK